MTDQQRQRWQAWWPVVATVVPLILAGFMAWTSVQSRLAVLEARIAMHEASSVEVSAAVEKRLGTIEADIKQLLQRPSK